MPLLDDVTATVAEANRRLVAVEAITADVKRVSGDMAKVTGVASTFIAGPLIKLSALSYGLRGAARNRAEARRLPAGRGSTRRPR